MIGGTGTISSAITRQLAESGHELWLLNRGTRKQEVPAGVKQVIADIDDQEAVLAGLGDAQFDAVCEFIGFVPEQVERDIRLFRGRTRQYIYISSASAYAKPVPQILLFGCSFSVSRHLYNLQKTCDHIEGCTSVEINGTSSRHLVFCDFCSCKSTNNSWN